MDTKIVHKHVNNPLTLHGWTMTSRDNEVQFTNFATMCQSPQFHESYA